MNLYTHLGKGWVYPYQYKKGSVDLAEYLDSVRSSIKLILDTKPGEIFMANHIGSRLWELVFMPIDEVFYALAEDYIKEAIYEQEPRVRNIEISFSNNDNLTDQNKVEIYMTYDVYMTGQTDSWVYEYYSKAA